MRLLHLMLPLPLAAAAIVLASSCHACTLKVAYTDQEVPPYYLGNGSAPADPPGASIELIQEMVASAGCQVTFMRLPNPRLRAALEAGISDATPFGIDVSDSDKVVYPLDRNGKIDRERSILLHTIIFVRAADITDKNIDPAQFLKGKKIGALHGVTYAMALRKAGYDVDDGATNTQRN